MKLRNKRYMTIKVGNVKLKKGHSMSINPSQITYRLQSLIRRGYFELLEEEVATVLAKNSEPDEDLPETDPAPPVPPAPIQSKKEEVDEIKEEQPVASTSDKPKITKRRRKKTLTESEE